LSCSGRPLDRPRPVKVIKNVREGKAISSIEFRDPYVARASPGQFLMVYVPGLDELPLAVSDVDGDVSTILVKAVGEGTRALCEMRVGDLFGVRGPYGNGFELAGAKDMLVGGGVGVAPLLLLAKRLKGIGSEVRAIVGASTRDDLAIVDALAAYSTVEVVTEDGSAGERGLASDKATGRILGEKFDRVYACGPEAMLAKLVNVCAGVQVPIQVSLERWIKCGTGLCGSCVLDPLGLLVCSDGPVFSGDQLRQVTDFGRFYRRASGIKVPF